jgi:hypothetical protein
MRAPAVAAESSPAMMMALAPELRLSASPEPSISAAIFAAPSIAVTLASAEASSTALPPISMSAVASCSTTALTATVPFGRKAEKSSTSPPTPATKPLPKLSLPFAAPLASKTKLSAPLPPASVSLPPRPRSV